MSMTRMTSLRTTTTRCRPRRIPANPVQWRRMALNPGEKEFPERATYENASAPYNPKVRTAYAGPVSEDMAAIRLGWKRVKATPLQDDKVNRIPKNAIKFVTASGQEFYAPEKTDFKAIHDSAKSTPLLDALHAAYDAILRYGTFDFQRNMGRGEQKNNYFYSAYTDASNYVVGVYMHGLGQSREVTLEIGRIILSLSKNTGDPRPKSMWLKGWDDADAGTFAEPKPPAK